MFSSAVKRFRSRLRDLPVIVALAVVTVGAAQSQTVTTTLPAGANPIYSAVNPVTNKVYVANNSSNTVTVVDGASNNTATVTVGSYPNAVGVNPVTNQIYITNSGSNNVTVIDGPTNNTTTVTAGSYPDAVAVNPVTNQIYVSNQGDGTVTVIDGVSNHTTTVNVGSYPYSVAVNPATNQIYVANQGDGTVTVIDGTSNTPSTVAVGTGPTYLAVNPVTNKIYVVNSPTELGDVKRAGVRTLAAVTGTVTVIDGVTNTTTTIAVGSNPDSVAVNPVTNRIYVPDYSDATVTVIDGASNNTTTVAVGSDPASVRVNPATNQIYVICDGTSPGTVAVIDGATNGASTLTVGPGPTSLAINPVTNKTYVTNTGGESASSVGVAPTSTNSITVIDGATDNTRTVSVGSSPRSAAINPVTDKIYVANFNSNNVTVIDGTTNSTTVVGTGVNPGSTVVNPVTNQIYVVNYGSNNVTVIDGATNNTTTIPVGLQSKSAYGSSLAVDPVLNQIYVANQGSNTVTVIDGATDNTRTIATGPAPSLVAINPVTDKIYVASAGIVDYGTSVTVIDGSTGNTATVAVAFFPSSIAVNPVTNKIYVASFDRNIVTVIDGATNNTTTVGVGLYPISLAVNPVTNQIYVANAGSTNVGGSTPGSITVIDGATNNTTNITAGTQPWSVAVNPVTNKIYVADNVDDSVTVIDGATNSTTTLPAGLDSNLVSVNPVTNQIYVVNENGNSVSVITEEQVQPIPLTTTVTPLALNRTFNLDPTFTFSAVSAFAPNVTTPDNVYFQVDSWQSAWSTAAGSNSSFTGTVATTLQPGFHILYAYAGDSQEATSTQGNSPLTGAIQAYGFLVTPPPQTIAFIINPPLQIAGTTLPLTGSANSGLPVTYSSSNSSVCSISGDTVSFLIVGNCIITASQAGSASYAPAPPVSQAISVNLAPQSITFAPIPNQALGTKLALNASASSGLPVSYTSSTPSVCTISGSKAALVSAGACTILASQAGNAVYAAAAAIGQSFAVIAPLAITNAALPNGTAGYVYSANLAARGGTTPYTWSVVTGSLPPGLGLNAATGAITGTPTAAGASAFTVQVRDSASPALKASQGLSISISAGLTITTTSLPSGTAGLAYSATLNGQSGTGPYTWTISTGALPAGLSLSAQTGAISGTPTTAGTFPLTIALSDSSTPTPQTATVSLSLLINPPVSAPPAAPTFTLSGLPASQTPGTNITSGTVLLSGASPAAYSGVLTLVLTPNESGLPAGYLGDAGFVDSSGNKSSTTTITIPAATTSVSLPALDPGTVAGSLAVNLSVGGQSATPSTIAINSSAPIIEANSVQITNVTSTGFDVEMVATSTPRDLKTATFTFTPASGAQISGTTSFTVDMSSLLTTWFASSSGLTYGGAFSLTQPFSLSGPASAIQSVTVTLSNSVGTSAAGTGTQ